MTAPTPPGTSALNLRVLLEEVIERGASDLHITAGERPMLRIDGDITRVEYRVRDAAEGHAAARVLGADGEPKEALRDGRRARFLVRHSEPGALPRQLLQAARLRARWSFDRFHSTSRPSSSSQLPKVIADLADKPKGLILVTGPTGSGKSTTLAAMIDKVDKELKGHMMTIEDPIEFIHSTRSASSTSAKSGRTRRASGRRSSTRCARIPTSC